MVSRDTHGHHCERRRGQQRGTPGMAPPRNSLRHRVQKIGRIPVLRSLSPAVLPSRVWLLVRSIGGGRRRKFWVLFLAYDLNINLEFLVIVQLLCHRIFPFDGYSTRNL